jgi:3-oxoacyl-[acyl-carrier-protein] synthase III
MLEQLRRKMDIPIAKMPIDLEDIGNTVSASIPILMCRCQERNVLKEGQRCVLAGFGVGYFWAMTYLTWGLSPVGS